MSPARIKHQPRLFAIPDELTSPTSKLVYLYLAQVHSTTTDQLIDDLNLSHLSVIPVIGHLVAAEVIDRDGDTIKLVE